MNAEKQFQEVISRTIQPKAKNDVLEMPDHRQEATRQTVMMKVICAKNKKLFTQQYHADVVQRYIEHNGFKSSNDKSVIFLENHSLYAEPNMKDSVNTILDRRNANVKLEGVGSYKYKGKSYEKLTGKDSHVSGDRLEITSDCGDCCRKVMGNDHPHGRFLSPKDSGIRRTKSLDAPKDMKNEICIYIRRTVKDIAYDDIRKISDESMLLQKLWKQDMSKHRIDVLKNCKDMELLQILDESHTLAKIYGVNDFANPGIGEGFTISSGGPCFSGERTWNFHWAGVIMESKKGDDKITFENYAVRIPVLDKAGKPVVRDGKVVSKAEINNKWNFDMYGSQSSQTFHAQHKGSKLHGHFPTTIPVK